MAFIINKFEHTHTHMSRFTKMSFLEKSSSNEILIKPDETTKPNSIFFSVRFLLTCLIFLAAGTQYMQKIDMGVAIVCMVNSTESKNDSNPNLNDTDTCLFKPSNVTKVTLIILDFNFN